MCSITERGSPLRLDQIRKLRFDPVRGWGKIEGTSMCVAEPGARVRGVVSLPLLLLVGLAFAPQSNAQSSAQAPLTQAPLTWRRIGGTAISENLAGLAGGAV